VLNVTGANILLGATVKLTKSGQPDIVATAIESLGDVVKCRVDITGTHRPVERRRHQSRWSSATLPAAVFHYRPALVRRHRKRRADWTQGNSQGSVDNWALVTYAEPLADAQLVCRRPASTNINDLTSPAIAIPGSATNLILSFGTRMTSKAGETVACSSSPWMAARGSTRPRRAPARVHDRRYNSTFATQGNPNTRNPLAPRACWTGANGGFAQVMISLTDTAKYAGHSLRIRWRLATNSSTSSVGWYVDDITLNGGGVAVISANHYDRCSRSSADCHGNEHRAHRRRSR
jgi:hypothetical protein